MISNPKVSHGRASRRRNRERRGAESPDHTPMAVQRLLAPYDHDGRAMEADLRRQLSAAGAEPEPEPEGPEPSLGGGRPEWVRAEVVQISHRKPSDSKPRRMHNTDDGMMAERGAMPGAPSPSRRRPVSRNHRCRTHLGCILSKVEQ